MWVYQQSTGDLYRDGKLYATGYSGHGKGRNNPDAQDIQKIGPIPQGEYSIGPAYTHQHLGPIVMNLDPKPGTEEFGRSAFRMHGDNAIHDASEGCIIMPRWVRVTVSTDSDKDLKVVR